MKKNKARGPDCLPIEEARALGDEGAIWKTGVLNRAMREGIPEEWRTSTMAHTRRVPVQRAVERDEIPYPYKVHDTTLRPLLHISRIY